VGVLFLILLLLPLLLVAIPAHWWLNWLYFCPIFVIHTPPKTVSINRPIWLIDLLNNSMWTRSLVCFFALAGSWLYLLFFPPTGSNGPIHLVFFFICGKVAFSFSSPSWVTLGFLTFFLFFPTFSSASRCVTVGRGFWLISVGPLFFQHPLLCSLGRGNLCAMISHFAFFAIFFFYFTGRCPPTGHFVEFVDDSLL